MRARQCLAPTRSGQKLHVSQRRGDPLGRPRPFMPTRSFMAGTNKSRGIHVPRDPLGRPGGFMAGTNAGRRRIGRGSASPLRGPAKSSMCANVGATHWVALGHSCQRARSWLGQTNREACLGMVGGAGRRRIRARQCLAPTRSGQKLHVSQRRGDPLGRPRSFMPARSFMAGTNKSRGMASGWWATRGVAG